MAITVCRFDRPLSAELVTYQARACGCQREDGSWEGWIEFDGDNGTVLRSTRETTQPNFTDLEYWATGLEPVFLEGSLERTLRAEILSPAPVPQPAFEEPAAHRPRASKSPAAKAVLDPYSVYANGGAILLSEELKAMNGWRLQQIIRAYGLVDEHITNIEKMSERELADLIVSRVAHESHLAS